MNIYTCEIRDESDNLLEIVELLGDATVNRLRRFLSKLGYELVEIACKPCK